MSFLNSLHIFSSYSFKEAVFDVDLILFCWFYKIVSFYADIYSVIVFDEFLHSEDLLTSSVCICSNSFIAFLFWRCSAIWRWAQASSILKIIYLTSCSVSLILILRGRRLCLWEAYVWGEFLKWLYFGILNFLMNLLINEEYIFLK